MNQRKILKIVERHRGEHGELISILEGVQDEYGYLPEDALRMVAKETGCSLVDVYGVATFYKFFSLKPRGKHVISVCRGTACHVRGASAIVEELKRRLGIKDGETTSDKEFTLETVRCLGACALGPILVADGHYFSKVAVTDVKNILEKVRAGLDEVKVKADKQVFPVDVSCPHCNHSLMDANHPIDGYPSVRVTVSFGGKHGWLRLSCLYGSYNIESEYEVPLGTVVNFFCPHCHAEFTAASKCPECGTPMVLVVDRRGGMLYICPRRGCKGHMLDLNELSFDEISGI